MILETFSQILQDPANRGVAPERLLYDWLVNTLLIPPDPNDQVAKVIHAEISLNENPGKPLLGRSGFANETGFYLLGRSETGDKLLNSLFNYCRSYDHWQFSRWVHQVNASDFHQR